MRHYRLSLWGYGGEAAYIGLTKEQYEYWSARREDYDNGDGEYDIVEYMVDPDAWLEENQLPEGMDFMLHKTETDEWHNPWYEAPNEFAHAWGGAIQGSLRIQVDEVEDDEYNSNMVKEGYTYESDVEAHEEEFDSVEYGMLTEMGSDEPLTEPDYVCQFWSAEKGTFYEATVSIDGEFDPSKLKFITEEYPNGDDVILDVQYDGESLDNQGGDTNGKGYSVHFWSNVNG